MIQPLIGISSASITVDNKVYNRAYWPIANGVANAGGLPVYIPTGLEESVLRAIYDRLDAVLLPGGPDVDPSIYGQERHPKVVQIDDPRDTLELTLARWTVEDDRPVFGICRGHQILNVALGGTLVQDIPSQVETDLTHDLPDEDPRNTLLHSVTLDPQSRLANILGKTEFRVNSLHHQSVQEAAPNVKITGHSPDGIVESLEIPEHPFALSVQWHPEDLVDDDDAMKALFKAFVDAAREYAENKK